MFANFPDRRATVMLLLMTGVPLAVTAQEMPAADTLSLSSVRALAADRDPRSVQPAIFEDVSRLSLANLRARHLPQLSLSGQATYQNEVPSLPAGVAGVIGPPPDQYRAQVEMDWLLYDGGRTNRQADVEALRFRENLAGVAVTLDQLQAGATEIYFSLLFLQSRENTLSLALEDIESRLALVRTRVREGAALPADAAALEAETLTLQQQIVEAAGDREAARQMLADLLQVPLTARVHLLMPDVPDHLLQAPVREAGPPGQTLRTPVLQQLDNQARRLQAEAQLATAARLPRVSLFGQAGVGRPGPFDFLSKDVNEYGLIGVRLRWSILDWGQARRRSQMIRQQASIATKAREALARKIVRDVSEERVDIARLEKTLAADARVVLLREQVLAAARAQLADGVLLPANYADRVTDLADARLTQERHQLELARAKVRLLIKLGRYPDDSNISLATLEAAKQ